MTAPTLSEVTALARNASSGVDSVNNCGMINDRIRLALQQDYGIDADLVRGTIDGHNGGVAHHMYLRLPAGALADTNQPVIVDGALDQFTDENLAAGRADAALGPAGRIPSVVVAPEGSHEYGYYTGATSIHS